MQELDLSNEKTIVYLFKIAKFFKDDKELYNLCLNRIKSLLKKELGKVILVNTRESSQNFKEDPIGIWEKESLKMGIVFDKEENQ